MNKFNEDINNDDRTLDSVGANVSSPDGAADVLHFLPATAKRINVDAYKSPKRLVEYIDGVPVPKMGTAINKKELDNLLLAAASQEYTAVDPITGEVDIDFVGFTNLEVAAIKHARKAALGDGESFRYMMDRLAGKAKQSVETVSVSMSLADYLAQLTIPLPDDQPSETNKKETTNSILNIALDEDDNDSTI